MTQEIEAREKAATPGNYYDSAGDVFQEGTRERIARCTSLSRDRADARFFAAAKRDIPYLLAELRDRDKKLEAVEALAERIRLCAAEAGAPKRAALLVVLLEIDRILHGGERDG